MKEKVSAMSGSERYFLTPRKLAEEFEHIYQGYLGDVVSDADLAPLLINSGFFTIKDAEDQELFYSTSTYLDEFLVSTVPEIVGFSEAKLLMWATDAIAFIKENVNHDSFADIFSSRLQYDLAIKNTILIDATGKFLVDYFRQLRIDKVYFGDALPKDFIEVVEVVAKNAVSPALVELAQFLTSRRNLVSRPAKINNSRTNKIKKSASFLNRKGAIPFAVDSGKLKFAENNATQQISQYRPAIDRAIKRLVEKRTLLRIDNMDRTLAELLSEYYAEIKKPVKKINIPIVWMCGLEINERVERQNAIESSDERLDEDDLFNLRRLIVSHNLFLNCFNESSDLLKHVESSAAIYQRMGVAAKRLSHNLLLTASENTALFEANTANALAKAASEPTSEGGIESKGLIALRLGLLRGLLHSAGGHVLSAVEKIIEKSTVEIASHSLIEALKSDAMTSAAIIFIQNQAHSLIQLSNDSPIYFGYLKHLLAMIGIHA